jgi:hypothetical protein
MTEPFVYLCARQQPYPVLMVIAIAGGCEGLTALIIINLPNLMTALLANMSVLHFALRYINTVDPLQSSVPQRATAFLRAELRLYHVTNGLDHVFTIYGDKNWSSASHTVISDHLPGNYSST